MATFDRLFRPFLQSCRTLVALVALAGFAGENMADDVRVYVGTYTNGTKSEGIYRFDLDTETGKATEPVVAAKVTNPSFLAVHKDGKHVYAVNEIDTQNGKKTGGMTAFEIQPNGDLKFLNAVETGGGAPCHITIDPSGKFAFFANYGGGSSGAVSIKPDGSLGELTAFVQHEGKSVNPQRQQGPHAHSINAHPNGKFVYVADLGLDKVLIFAFDPATGKMTPAKPDHVAVEPGSGPRHFAFAPGGGKRAYVINEIGNTIVAFDVNGKTGELTKTQTVSTLDKEYLGKSFTAEVVAHPNGRYVYGSNRGFHSITAFGVELGGRLTKIGIYHSEDIDTPRNFAIDPSGNWMLIEGQNTGLIQVHEIDEHGMPALRPVSTVKVPTPVCVRFLPLKP